MLRALVILPLTLIACSKDRPAPVAPVGKSLASLAAPPAPTNLRFDAPTDTSCTVRWDASDGATDYDVNYKPAVGGRWTNEPHRGTGLSNTIHDLQPNTEYRWAVRAENSDGASEWVFGPNFTTRSSEDDGLNGVPPAPTNLRFDAPSEASCTVRWDASDGATDYDVNYKPAVGGKWTNQSHTGIELSNTIHDLQPNTEYRWAVRAENSDGASEWVHGPNFTTQPAYILFSFDGSLSNREQEIFAEAVVDWKELILAGHPDGISIQASTDVQMTVAGQLGFANITKMEQANDRWFNTECFIGLSSMSRWRSGLSQEIKEDTFLYVVTHEIGHCLGIGVSSEWEKHLEFLQGWNYGNETFIETEPGRGIVTYEKIEGLIAPSFVGQTAQKEFLRLADDQWGNYPYVPLNWDRTNGIDTAHLDDPILRMSVMSSGGVHYGFNSQMRVSIIDAAILQDIGYTVLLSEAQDIPLVAGYRQIDPGDLSLGSVIETLFFPEWSLEYWSGDRGYKAANLTGRHIPINDPSIKKENLFYLDLFLLEHDKEEADENVRAAAAGKRIASHPTPWCGVGQ